MLKGIDAMPGCAAAGCSSNRVRGVCEYEDVAATKPLLNMLAKTSDFVATAAIIHA